MAEITPLESRPIAALGSHGPEAAQLTLGHANANVTQIYADRHIANAAEIMREMG